MLLIYNSYKTITLFLVIVSITCLVSTERVDYRDQRQQQEADNKQQQQIVNRQQHYSLDASSSRNRPLADSSASIGSPMQLDEAYFDRLIRSARAREEASPSFIEPKRRRSKRLQMMAKDQKESVSDEASDGQSGQQEEAEAEEKAKQVLRKRWHKLADDLIDGVFAKQQQQQQDSKSSKSSYKKKNWSTKQQQQDKDGIEKIMILMKKPLSESTLDSDDININNENNNLNNLLLTSPPQQEQQQQTASLPSASNLNRRPNVNMQEHARRILDDKFGIMKESMFTTNNHLGLKGVPKFGSEEEY